MGKNKKKFIDKKNAATFRLVFRDANDSTTPNGAAERIFVRTDDGDGYVPGFSDDYDGPVVPPGEFRDATAAAFSGAPRPAGADEFEDEYGEFDEGVDEWLDRGSTTDARSVRSAARSANSRGTASRLGFGNQFGLDDSEAGFFSGNWLGSEGRLVSGPLPDPVRKEVIELGLPDDGYDYLQHLRVVGEGAGGVLLSAFLSGSAIKGKASRGAPKRMADVRVYDATGVHLASSGGAAQVKTADTRGLSEEIPSDVFRHISDSSRVLPAKKLAALRRKFREERKGGVKEEGKGGKGERTGNNEGKGAEEKGKPDDSRGGTEFDVFESGDFEEVMNLLESDEEEGVGQKGGGEPGENERTGERVGGRVRRDGENERTDSTEEIGDLEDDFVVQASRVGEGEIGEEEGRRGEGQEDKEEEGEKARTSEWKRGGVRGDLEVERRGREEKGAEERGREIEGAGETRGGGRERENRLLDKQFELIAATYDSDSGEEEDDKKVQGRFHISEFNSVLDDFLATMHLAEPLAQGSSVRTTRGIASSQALGGPLLNGKEEGGAETREGGEKGGKDSGKGEEVLPLLVPMRESLGGVSKGVSESVEGGRKGGEGRGEETGQGKGEGDVNLSGLAALSLKSADNRVHLPLNPARILGGGEDRGNESERGEESAEGSGRRESTREEGEGEEEAEEEEDLLVELSDSSEEGERMDCESVISAYSNLYNHPAKIEIPAAVGRLPKKELTRNSKGGGEGEGEQGGGVIRLVGAAQMPVGYLPERDIGRRGKRGGRQGEEEGAGEKGVVRERRKGETAEEKKLRKAAVKVEKAQARAKKKDLKLLYKAEGLKAQRGAASTVPQGIKL